MTAPVSEWRELEAYLAELADDIERTRQEAERQNRRLSAQQPDQAEDSALDPAAELAADTLDQQAEQDAEREVRTDFETDGRLDGDYAPQIEEEDPNYHTDRDAEADRGPEMGG